MIHNTHVSKFIHPGLITKSAGTWTPTLSSNKYFERRTAADANFFLAVPITIPSNSVDLTGAYLTSIDLFFNITVGAMDDFATVELEKQTLSSVGAHTGAAVTCTIDTSNDTAAERKATGEHKMTVTLSTPEWVDNDEAFVLYCLVDGSAAGVFDLVGARANFTLRL